MFDYLRGLPQRHGIAVLLKPGESNVTPLTDINTAWEKFTSTVIETDAVNIAVQDQYYIYGIPKSILDRNHCINSCLKSSEYRVNRFPWVYLAPHTT